MLIIVIGRQTLDTMMYADICSWHHTPPAIGNASQSRNIFVVDDHLIMRKGYKALVQLEPDLSIIGDAAGAHEALDKLKGIKPDLVITDVSMEDLNGFELTSRIKVIRPHLPVLIASSYDRETHGPRAHQAGARGFIEKNALMEHGLNVIRCTLTHQACNKCPYLFDA